MSYYTHRHIELTLRDTVTAKRSTRGLRVLRPKTNLLRGYLSPYVPDQVLLTRSASTPSESQYLIPRISNFCSRSV